MNEDVKTVYSSLVNVFRNGFDSCGIPFTADNFCNACKGSCMYVCCDDCLCSHCSYAGDCNIKCYPDDDYVVSSCAKFVER